MGRKNRWKLQVFLTVILLLWGCFVPFVAKATQDVEPFSPDNGICGLEDLKGKIKKETNKYKGTWSVYVKNLDTNEYMVINDKKMPSASLIKIYTMMAVYEQANQKQLTLDKKNRKLLQQMITVSSNEACNRLTGKLTKKNTFSAGKKHMNAYCRRNGYDKTKFLVQMGKSSKKNVTSTKNCGDALERIYRGQCVNRTASKEMLKLLKKQTRRGKIPAGVPKGVKVANKTGETYFAENDAAIVYSKGADYIIVVMSYQGSDAVKGIQKISRLTYTYFNEKNTIE